MFDRIIAYFRAAKLNRRLADELASMTHRDLADIGIDRADIPSLLEQNFDRLYSEALEQRQGVAFARRQAV